MVHYVLDARTATPHFPGIGSYCRNLARALVPLLTSGERLLIMHAPTHSLDIPLRGGVSCVPVDASPFSLRQQWTVPRILRQLDANIYHSTYYLMPYRPGVPTLITFYDLIPIRFPQYSSFQARIFFRLASQLALKTSQHCVVISSATQQDMTHFLAADPQRLTLTPLAAAPQFKPQSAEVIENIRHHYDLPSRFILYLGSNKPHKNINRLIEAFASLRDLGILLVIAGTWLPQYPESRHTAMNLSLDEPNLRWLGAVAAEDLPALYSAALAFVFPSMIEGFGLPVLEAMACGTPVICSRIPSLSEVAGDAAEFFDPANTLSITHALRNVLESTERQDTLRQHAVNRAAQFTWEKTAQTTLTLYRNNLAIPFD